MAMINNGGNFSDDPIARLIAMKMGSMNTQDLDKQEAIPQQAVDLAAGTMGTVGKVPGINSVGKGIKLIPTAEQQLAEQYAQKYANAPQNFFEKFGRSGEQSIKSADEQAAQQLQQSARDQRFAQRLGDQTAERKDVLFQKLKQMMSNK